MSFPSQGGSGGSGDGSLTSGGTASGAIIIDAGGGSGNGLTINDSGSLADVKLYEASGVAVLDGNAGVTLKVNGTDEVVLSAAAFTPGSAAGNALGTTTVPWLRLCLGDSGTDRVNFEIDANGILNINEPNGNADATIRVYEAGGTNYLSLSASSGATTALDTSTADGTLTISDPNSVAGGALHILDSAGNADVKLSENGGGGALLDGLTTCSLAVNGSSKITCGTHVGITGQANLYPLGTGQTLGQNGNGWEAIYGKERSSNPTGPSEGYFVIWMSDGTGHGADGDVLIASQAGGVTNYAVVFDHSAGTTF